MIPRVADAAPQSSFASYVATVENMALDALGSARTAVAVPSLAKCLDGQASAVLRETVPLFIRLAKARLVLLAVFRGAAGSRGCHVHWDDILPEIRTGDGLDPLRNGWAGGHIVMNPPFIYRSAPAGAAWTSGRTNLAATFLATAIEHARSGTRLTAILPDVIRTGSRYHRLRSFVEKRLRMVTVASYGRFDAWTDVDVFILRGVVDNHLPAAAFAWWPHATGTTLGDRCEVRIGPIVPHRHVPEGPPQHFRHAQTIPLGGVFDVADAKQQGFQGRPFFSPFVVVRRTSRPGDRSRGIGTLIQGTGGIQVENHLIVLKPKDNSPDTCRRVIDLLQSQPAQQWLDERIHCRPLTVRALREMPWFQA